MSKMFGIQILSILIVLVCNFWSWELFTYNLFLFLIVWTASILLYLSIIRSSKKLLYIFCLILIPVLIIQLKTTKNAVLDYMSETDRQLFATRRGELSAIVPNLGKYLESKPEYIFLKFEHNSLRATDLNLYFFGSHPRERSGIREFEKFSFLFLPFFIFGLLKAIKSAPLQLSISLLIPLVVLSVIGEDNLIGPFSLFPFFSVMIAIGLASLIKKI